MRSIKDPWSLRDAQERVFSYWRSRPESKTLEAAKFARAMQDVLALLPHELWEPLLRWLGARGKNLGERDVVLGLSARIDRRSPLWAGRRLLEAVAPTNPNDEGGV